MTQETRLSLASWVALNESKPNVTAFARAYAKGMEVDRTNFPALHTDDGWANELGLFNDVGGSADETQEATA